jgi:uncharacterized protein (TIGR00369 family)
VRMLERMQAIADGSAPGPPVAQLVGMKLVEVEPGRAVFVLDTDERHHNPMGTVHGGILCDVADGALGCAWASMLEDDESFTTLELKINFLRPLWSGRLTATATVTKHGRHTGMAECEIVDEAGRLIAKASSTLMTLRDELARGR